MNRKLWTPQILCFQAYRGENRLDGLSLSRLGGFLYGGIGDEEQILPYIDSAIQGNDGGRIEGIILTALDGYCW